MLRTESEVLKGLVENAAAFMAVVDGTGKIVLMNSLMLQSLGYTADEVIGMQFASRFIPERFMEQVWPDLATPTVKSRQSRRVGSYVLAKGWPRGSCGMVYNPDLRFNGSIVILLCRGHRHH